MDEFGVSEVLATSNEELDHIPESNSDDASHINFHNVSNSKDSEELIIDSDHNDEIEVEKNSKK